MQSLWGLCGMVADPGEFTSALLDSLSLAMPIVSLLDRLQTMSSLRSARNSVHFSFGAPYCAGDLTSFAHKAFSFLEVIATLPRAMGAFGN